MEILRAENLTKTFSRPGKEPVTAVNHVSLSLQEGEIVGMVGESGSGKSTIAKLLTGLLPPTEGTLFLEGNAISGLRGRALREIYQKIQMVFQDPAGSFDPRRTLGQGIGESLRNSGRSRADTARRVEALLEQCGLPADFARRYPHEVSGGECQRAAIARALAIAPKILICDEATSALDVTVQQQTIALLRDLQQKNHMSYLFICHNLALVQQFCDRVLILQAGTLAEEGTPNQIIRHPQSDYTKRLVEAAL